MSKDGEGFVLGEVTTASGTSRPAATIHDAAALDAGLRALGLGSGRRVVVLVGGAGRMDDDDLARCRPFLRAVATSVEQLGAVVVDGGTDAGVMRLVGEARRAIGASFPLVGVAAVGTVDVGGAAQGSGTAPLQPDHTHVLLVPGAAWGDESPWIAATATALAGDAGSVTLVVNGGDIAMDDVRASLAHGRPVLVAAGSGRTADAIARGLAGDGGPSLTVPDGVRVDALSVRAEPAAVHAALDAAVGGARA